MKKALISLVILCLLWVAAVEVVAYSWDRSPITLYHAPAGYVPAEFGTVLVKPIVQFVFGR